MAGLNYSETDLLLYQDIADSILLLEPDLLNVEPEHFTELENLDAFFYNNNNNTNNDTTNTNSLEFPISDSQSSSSSSGFASDAVSAEGLEGIDDSFNDLLSDLNNQQPQTSPLIMAPLQNAFDRSNNEQLKVIAQPKPLYRGRYVCEQGNQNSQPNRFIRTGQRSRMHQYPTIRVCVVFLKIHGTIIKYLFQSLI
ncbi:hypothetical protein I4U23_007142 [Adineta vaga]|nr:hypothetical protein I4U23_007142 [Adineta vaga]